MGLGPPLHPILSNPYVVVFGKPYRKAVKEIVKSGREKQAKLVGLLAYIPMALAIYSFWPSAFALPWMLKLRRRAVDYVRTRSGEQAGEPTIRSKK